MLRILSASRRILRQNGRMLCQNGQKSSCFLHTSSSVQSTEIKMPSLSPTMTEGTIVKWLKSEGEEFSAGDVLCEIQTDKAVVSLEADDDGKIAVLMKNQDSGTIKVGQLIAIAADPDENWEDVAKEMSGKLDELTTSSPSEAEQEPEPEEEVVSAPSGGSTPGTEIKMPSLSPTMTEGTIVKWCKKEGEKVMAGDVLAEIQTDKAVVSMEVDDDAILAKILVEEGGSAIKVGQLIALTVEEGEDWTDVQIPAIKKLADLKPADSPPTKSPDAKTKESESPSTMFGDHVYENLPQTGPATTLLLAQYGIKSGDVTSSGPKGLLKSDVWKYIEERNLKPLQISLETEKVSAKADDTSAIRTPKARTGYTDHPLTSMRATIAKRLTESKQTSPHGYSTVATNIEALLRLRKAFAVRGAHISLNDFIIKAVATTLQHVPEVNLNISGDDFQIMPNIDISVAVATDTGLITPIVKDVPNKSIQQISSEVRELAAKAREGRLKLDEFQGGTFTISNLGMFGISHFTAIINPPQVGIMAIGSGVQEIDPNTGKVFTSMKSTLSFDRRFVDEALANDFMHTFQTVIEEPEFMNIGLERIVRKNRAVQKI